MGKIIDITDKKFNMLTARKMIGLIPLGKAGKKRALWECDCDCGKTGVRVTSNALRNNNTKSCGCYKTQVIRRPKTHGYSRTRIYETWSNMISRCEYGNRPDFEHYGGRGISVCQRWRDSFEDFLADMGDRPFPRATLERINVNGNYEPGNVRWATQKEQTRNKRNNRLVTISGVTKTVAEWAEESGVSQKLLLQRINNGWPLEEAISPRRRNKWSRRKKATA